AGRGGVRKDRPARHRRGEAEEPLRPRGARQPLVGRSFPGDPPRLGAGFIPGEMGIRRGGAHLQRPVPRPLDLRLLRQRRFRGQPRVRQAARPRAQGARPALHAPLHRKVHGTSATPAARCRRRRLSLRPADRAQEHAHAGGAARSRLDHQPPRDMAVGLPGAPGADRRRLARRGRDFLRTATPAPSASGAPPPGRRNGREDRVASGGGNRESGQALSGRAGPSTGIESMSDITRRDFLNGVALAIAAGLTPMAQVRAGGARYPPALTGMRGQHAGAFEVAHELSAGRRFPLEGLPIEERYDLLVVGGGISGLAAAWFYRRVEPAARILILDNHDDFGGHAKRNEFHLDGRLVIGYGGSESLQSPKALYSEVA